MSEFPSCPLCGNHETLFYFEDKKRSYHQCGNCDLVFVGAEYQLSAKDEKEEYDKHENALDDKGYLQFLSRMYEPVLERIRPSSAGLDFGSGPAPALAQHLRSLGHQVDTYDLYYAPDTSVFNNSYDFITCTEVIEHLATPLVEFEQMLKLLRPDGVLGIMTKLVINKERFANWHYKNDPTHISFFSRKAFEYLAQCYNLNLEFIGQDVMIFTKAQ